MGFIFVALTYLICAMTNKFLKPNTILYALLTGIVVTQIPWWISLHINYNINFDSLIRNFFEGTKMSYSIAGAISGYLLYKLSKLFQQK